MAFLSLFASLLIVATVTARRSGFHTQHGRRAALSREAERFNVAAPNVEDVRAALAASTTASPTGRSLAGLPASRLNLSSIVSVLDFGAVPDGTTDNTAAFNAAFASLAPGGGIVFAPAGQWAFLGSIIMTQATSLVGTYATVPSHSHDGAPADGTVLLPLGGRGVESGGVYRVWRASSSYDPLTAVHSCSVYQHDRGLHCARLYDLLPRKHP